MSPSLQLLLLLALVIASETAMRQTDTQRLAQLSWRWTCEWRLSETEMSVGIRIPLLQMTIPRREVDANYSYRNIRA